MNSSVLVTGCAGFIGHNLVQKLISDGNIVFGLDNLNSILYSSEKKQKNLHKIIDLPNFKFIEFNLLDGDFNKLDLGIEIVINLAALPGQALSWLRFDDYIDNNIKTLHNLIKYSIDTNVKRIVHASTSSVYGHLAVGDENSLTNPVSPYGITKLASEKLLIAYNKYFGLDFNILRFFSVYGPGQRPDMAISKFIDKIKNSQMIEIHGKGEQIRDFTFVSDAVQATINAMNSESKNEIFNISGGGQCSLNELIQKLEKILGKKATSSFVERPIGDQDQTFADITKANQMLSYHPKFSLDEGLNLQIND
jgi:UDP-glucuronate 4-epimerase